MKRALFLIVLGVMCGGISLAQKVTQGSFSALADVHRAAVEIDYSEGMIQGMSEEDYSFYEPDWERDRASVGGKFIAMFNDKQRRIFLTSKTEGATCIMVLKVLNVTRQGDIRAEILMKDPSTNEILLAIGNIAVKGGHFGSGLNLMGDGMKNLGEKMAYYFKRHLK